MDELAREYVTRDEPVMTELARLSQLARKKIIFGTN